MLTNLTESLSVHQQEDNTGSEGILLAWFSPMPITRASSSHVQKCVQVCV